MAILEAMPTVTTADLKQNPAAVLRKVMKSGAHRITAHGRPTGAVISPERSQKKDSLSGAELMALAARSPMPPGAGQRWLEDIESAYVDDDYIN
jgi:prevent-host-death family protein